MKSIGIKILFIIGFSIYTYYLSNFFYYFGLNQKNFDIERANIKIQECALELEKNKIIDPQTAITI